MSEDRQIAPRSGQSLTLYPSRPQERANATTHSKTISRSCSQEGGESEMRVVTVNEILASLVEVEGHDHETVRDNEPVSLETEERDGRVSEERANATTHSKTISRSCSQEGEESEMRVVTVNEILASLVEVERPDHETVRDNEPISLETEERDGRVSEFRQ